MQPDRGPLSRRALLAALVGGGSALAVRLVSGAELAGAAQPPVLLSTSNTGYGDTVVQNASTSTTARGLHGRAKGSGVTGTQTSAGNTGSLGQGTNGVFGQAYTSAGNGVRGVADNGALAYGVWGSAQAGTGVVGQGPTGVSGTSFATNGSGLRGSANTGADAAGVAGASTTGYGVSGNGRIGVEGSIPGGATYGRLGQSTTGVQGYAATTNGTGVVGQANTGTLAFGVWGRSTSGYAGYFSGPVHATGGVTSSAAGFLVDHPQDPTGKLLGQAWVASDERLSTYSGNVTTGADGRATVRLPGYVASLNDDFRYQLTVVGGFAQAIVGQKVRDGAFVIHTNAPGVEVSWQVTGVRQDAYAQRHPFHAEQVKRGAMAGRLLQPELHGATAAEDVTAVHGDAGMHREARPAPAGIDRKIRDTAGGDAA